MKIEIEKNIPCPSKSKYPFQDMEVGDSFFVEAEPRNIQGAVAYYRKQSGNSTAFSCREAVKDGKKGCRVWRTK